MAQISKTTIDSALRNSVFTDFLTNTKDYAHEYVKINDRQYGTIITDVNGVERYVRIGVIVAEEREDMTARELMDAEIAAYNAAQQKKAEKKAAALAKKAEREKAKKEKDKEGSEE